MASMLPTPPPTDPATLYRHRDAVCVTDALVAAVAGLDLLTEISKSPATVPDLARRLGVAERPLDVIVTLLRALGWVEGTTALACTPIARDHLVKGSPFYIAPYYASLASRPQVVQLMEVLRTDKPASWGGAAQPKAWADAMQDEAFADGFTAAMDCRGAYLAPALAKVPLDPSQSKRLLDIAGGSGIYACALVEANPGLRATVLERAPMDRVTLRHVAKRGFSDRVGVFAGDMFADPYPPDHDVHLLSNVLHDWDEASVRRLLAKSAAALPAGGRLVIHDAHLDADKAGPLEVAEYSVFLMHATVGRCYSVEEIALWLAEVGLGSVVHLPTAAYRSAIVATKPKDYD
jgi:3-hydroxy-5-methyl-1-naphthoate 3-O-methyltransferase